MVPVIMSDVVAELRSHQIQAIRNYLWVREWRVLVKGGTDNCLNNQFKFVGKDLTVEFLYNLREDIKKVLGIRIAKGMMLRSRNSYGSAESTMVDVEFSLE